MVYIFIQYLEVYHILNIAIVDDDNDCCVEVENVLIEYLKKY